MSNIPLISFNSGELSPLIDTRSDVEKYSSGCRTLENMIPRIYGCAERRPGTKYIYETKSSGQVRLVKFEYSSSIAYVIEFGNTYCRFYYDGAIVLDGASPEEIVTPYVTADLNELQFSQVADTLRIVHPNYAPRILSRVSATEFSIAVAELYSGPMLERNDILNDDDVTMTASAVTGDDITLTASAATFTEDHIGGLFRLDHLLEATSVSGNFTSATSSSTITIQEGREYDFTTHGVWTGTITLERSYDDGSNYEAVKIFSSNDNANIQQTGEELNVIQVRKVRKTTSTTTSSSGGEQNYLYAGVQWEDEALYRVTMSSYTSGTCNYELQAKPFLNSGFVYITAYTSTTVVTGNVVTRDIGSTDATKKWAEGAFSDEQGWPAAIALYEERCIYGKGDMVYLSATGEWNNFEEGINDNDSFKLQLASDSVQDIMWIAPLEALLIGTTNGEWRIRATSIDSALTPSDFNIRQQTSYGSKQIQAITVNDTVVFVDLVGRKVRELSPAIDTDKYVAPDLTALAEHITAT